MGVNFSAGYSMVKGSMLQTALQKILSAWLRRKASPAEEKAVDEWWDLHQDTGPDLIGDFNEPAARQFIQDLWAKIETGAGLRDTHPAPIRKISSRFSFAKIRPIAASLLVFAGATSLLTWLLHTNKNAAPGSIYKKAIAITAPANLPATTILYNAGSAVLNYILPDSSLIRLHPGSEIRYTPVFNQQERRLELRGKAYFKVTHQPDKPFVVSANGYTTTALGTSFTIDARAADSNNTRIELHTGKVVVKSLRPRDNWKDIFLRPLQTLEINGNKQPLITSTKKSSPKPTQTKPCISGYEAAFQQAPLTEVFNQIQKAYHIEMILDPEVLSHRFFTGSIRTGDCLHDLLHRLAVLHGLTIVQKENKYIIQIN